MRSTPQILRLLVMTLVLPAVIILVDEAVVGFAIGSGWSLVAVALVYLLFVAQTGLLALLVGRWRERWLLRLAVFTWAIVLVDSELFRMSRSLELYGWPGPLAYTLVYTSPYTFVAAQVGLVTIWAALGTTSWQVRFPAVVAPAAAVACLVRGLADHSGPWTIVLVVETLALIGVLVAVRVWGFHLEFTEQENVSEGSGVSAQHLRFSVWHLLIWTAAAAPILMYLRGRRDIRLQLEALVWEGWLQSTSLGCCCAVLSLACMWAAFGTRAAMVRAGVLAATAVALGLLVRSVNVALIPAAVAATSGWIPVWAMYEMGWWWITWTSLAGAFLFCLLLALRFSGYRLVRRLSGGS